jgi:hypothetical protein
MRRRPASEAASDQPDSTSNTLAWKHSFLLAVLDMHCMCSSYVHASALMWLLLLLLLPLPLRQELAKGPKLVLRADDEAQLMAVADAARAQGLPCHSVAEATGG